MALKPKQDENIANDKRKQILSAVHMTPASDNSIQDTFNKYIVAGYLLDKEGQIVDSTQNVAFDVDMKNNIKASERKLPVFKCRLDDGSIKYIVPVYGAGLWGPIWGYIAVDDNGTDIYGAYFSHEGETPGLGAEISKPAFQDQFKGKKLYKDGQFKPISVLKKGKPSFLQPTSVWNQPSMWNQLNDNRLCYQNVIKKHYSIRCRRTTLCWSKYWASALPWQLLPNLSQLLSWESR